MAANTSKTARASVRAGQSKSSGLSVLGEFKYLIPLNKGKHVYVRNITNGQTVHHAVDSEAIVEELKVLTDAGHGEKIQAELESFAKDLPAEQNWADTLKNLRAAGAFGEVQEAEAAA
ncbi:hypothetical protein [Natronoglycomyces albus]|uniref:Uncharacterized protein n=1 Tax=Natronoglycomyces albus TaxID=2811108 RepID=A0A895XSN7_9ACTN|nr:hypothetical protein [Natronoglycomyces albus]QSB06255.1 hypothetical protein JQS30_04930 [Natronoglycomyces albus]